MNDLTNDALTPLLPVLTIYVGVVFLLIGSFLNVVIYRLPQGKSIVKPRSSCPLCGHMISARDNVPVVSWLLLRGRCRGCQAPISKRYPLVELGTGALAVAMTVHFGFSLLLPAFLYLVAVGVALTMIDFDHQRLPDALVKPSWIAVPALLALSLPSLEDPTATFVRAVSSAGVWLLVYGALWLLPALLFGKTAMGFGDVKLAPVLGYALGWLGWGPSVVGLFGGFLLGGVVGIVLIVAGKAGRKSKVAHGPFMLIATVLAVLVGQGLWTSYLTTMGLAGVPLA